MKPAIDNAAPLATESPEGDYWFVDVMTNKQGAVSVYDAKDGTFMVRHGLEAHPLDEFDKPNIRWFKINPIPVDKIPRLMMVGV